MGFLKSRQRLLGVKYFCKKLNSPLIHLWKVITQKQPPDVFCKNGILRNFAKWTGKRLCQRLFFNKIAGARSATLLKKSLWQRCCPVNFAKFLRTPFLQNTSGRVFLITSRLQYKYLFSKLFNVYLFIKWFEFICKNRIFRVWNPICKYIYYKSLLQTILVFFINYWHKRCS